MSAEKIISQEDVEKVAQLARIEITKEEKNKFARELSEILGHFKEISALDVGEVEKVEFLQIEQNQARKDETVDEADQDKEEIRKQFPQSDDNYLKVKAVL